MRNALLAVIALAIVVGAGIYLLGRDDDNKNVVENQTQTQEQSDDQQTQADPDAEHLQGANIGATLDATDQTAVTITMSDFKFEPTRLKIKKGTTVTWQNNGDNGHDVTPASNSPNEFEGSELLNKGEKYSFTFDEVGKYYYFCSPHSSEMRGIIEVVE